MTAVSLRNIISKLLLEAIPTTHYLERKKLRGKVLDIKIPQKIYNEEDLPQIKSKLIPLLNIELNKRLSSIERTDYPKGSFTLGKIVLTPYLKVDGKNYPIRLVIQDKNNSTSIGTTFVDVINNNALTTFLLSPSPDNDIIKDKLEDHNRRHNINKPIKLIPSEHDNVIYSLDTLLGKDTPTQSKPQIDPDSLPYIVRAAYRPGTNITHKKYGVGKIVKASSGGTRSGDPDSRGVVSSVEVDFFRPYSVGGVLHKTRKLGKMYTTSYFKPKPLQEQIDKIYNKLKKLILNEIKPAQMVDNQVFTLSGDLGIFKKGEKVVLDDKSQQGDDIRIVLRNSKGKTDDFYLDKNDDFEELIS